MFTPPLVNYIVLWSGYDTQFHFKKIGKGAIFLSFFSFHTWFNGTCRMCKNIPYVPVRFRLYALLGIVTFVWHQNPRRVSTAKLTNWTTQHLVVAMQLMLEHESANLKKKIKR